ncbi:MAG: hypothetical protein WCG10_08000 [Chlamydiota bacterium]
MAKKNFIQVYLFKTVLSFSLLSVLPSLQAIRYMSHKSVSTEVELVDGKEFSHSVISDKGLIIHEFCIDRVPVQQDDFYKAADLAYLADLRKERQDCIKRQESRMIFIDDCKRAIIEKSLKNTIFAAQQAFDRLNHESLKPYLKFCEKTVQSPYQLAEMKKYLELVGSLLKDLAKKNDIDGMQEILKKIEQWSDRFEACFKSSVESAIAQCDDTIMLKDLLTLVSAT